MLLNILLTILVIDCIALTGVILLQRSEGGALGMGSGPSGMFTARGAGDLLTRTTSILTIVFFSLSLLITVLAGHNKAGASLTEHMKVNPLDVSALAKAQKGGAPPPASSTETAPPLPNAAPPLPNEAAPPPPGAPAPAARAPAKGARAAAPASVGLPTLPQSVALPHRDLGLQSGPPASQSPAAPKP
jgi:preprotein translocase subunit SecG